MDKKRISVVSPVYGCKSHLRELYMRLVETLELLTNDFEIIFVNDASPDDSWNVIVEIAARDSRLKGLNLSRNFGQHYAITAGLEHCTGDWIVVIDCDLQDKPEEILQLYTKASEGYDIVLGKRNNRSDYFLKRLFSFLFYKFLNYLTDKKHDYYVANFGIYSNKVIKSILKMGDSIRYFPTMVHWVGYKSVTIEVVHCQRKGSKTSYSFGKRIRLASDIILTFSDKPMRLTIILGFIISLGSVLFAIYNLILYLKGLIVVPGWTSLIISIWFLSGIIIFILGIVGLYIGKTFEKVKDRPIYLVADSINC